MAFNSDLLVQIQNISNKVLGGNEKDGVDVLIDRGEVRAARVSIKMQDHVNVELRKCIGQ